VKEGVAPVCASISKRYMPFTKRHLTEAELSLFKFSALGVMDRRVPDREWNWAVDLDSDAFYTQLISNTYEMREGDWWYLLVVRGKPFTLTLNPFSSTTINGEMCTEAVLAKSDLPASELASIQQLAKEAHRVLSSQGEQLLFVAGKIFGSA